VEVTTERLRTLAQLIDRGELKTWVGAVLPFKDARDAHMMLEGRLTPPKGKIVLNLESAGEGVETAAAVRAGLPAAPVRKGS
jgi:hypothetical protein